MAARAGSPRRTPITQRTTVPTLQRYTLDEIIKSVAKQRNLSLRELELRMSSPGNVAGTFFETDVEARSLAEMYAWLIDEGGEWGTITQPLASSCGATSSQLADILFKGPVQERYGEAGLLREILRGNTQYIRVTIGCHSFMVERQGDTQCRIYQSYFGYDALADTLDRDKPMPTDELADKISRVIHKSDKRFLFWRRGRHERGEAAQDELFHGQVDARANRQKGQPYSIIYWVPSGVHSKRTVLKKINAILDELDATWGEVSKSKETIAKGGLKLIS